MLFELTGNPFIDTGTFVLLNLTNKTDLSQLQKADLNLCINQLVEIFISDNWKGPLTQIFPNSKIANFKIKPLSKREVKYKEHLILLLSQSTTPNNKSSSCWGCSNRKGSIFITRCDFPLAGAKGVVNFYPSWDNGAKICPNCLLAVQFSALAMLKSADKLVLLHSNSSKVMKTWIKFSIAPIRGQMTTHQYSGLSDFGYKNQINFIFFLASKIMDSYDENCSKDTIFIRIYFFTNYMQHKITEKGPNIYWKDIPSPVFHLLVDIKQARLIQEWMQFIYSWTKKNQKDVDILPEEAIKTRNNPIYEFLIQEKSITSYFLNKKEKKTRVNWQILEIYSRDVLKMKKETLDYIKIIGDKIFDVIQKQSSRKRLTQIEMSKKYDEFRGVLLNLEKDSMKFNNEPLFKVDDLMANIFPETDYGFNWKESRDFLLFRIYEIGFEFLRQFVNIDDPEDILTVNDENFD